MTEMDVSSAAADSSVVYLVSEGLQNPTETSRWAERFVTVVLREKYPRATLRWLNEDMEVREPYDLVLDPHDGPRVYVEIKSTVSHDRTSFEMSANEVAWAIKEGAQYWICHVRGAGQADARVMLIRDPVSLFGRGLQLVVHVAQNMLAL